MGVYNNILECIGKTPLVSLDRFAQLAGADAQLMGKLERQNPGGSVKDRAALAMVEEAERQGKLQEGGTIVEPTSGNTGIGLAMVAAVKGYRMILTMPESMSMERRQLLMALGAKIELTPAKEGMAGAISRAKELTAQLGAFMPQQFENPANPSIHETQTAREIIDDLPNGFDALISAVGTGGTISGLARGLRQVFPNVQVIAVEPKESPILSGGQAGPHGIQGIGANFVPENYDRVLVDQVITVSTQAAYEASRLLAKSEGVLCGISSGAALQAAVDLSRQSEYRGKRIVVILPDTGERYLSTPLFAQ